jgi:hypothetical protein
MKFKVDLVARMLCAGGASFALSHLPQYIAERGPLTVAMAAVLGSPIEQARVRIPVGAQLGTVHGCCGKPRVARFPPLSVIGEGAEPATRVGAVAIGSGGLLPQRLDPVRHPSG